MTLKTLLGATAAAALILAGCATTTFTSTWKDPEAGPLRFQPGEKVIALVVTEQESIRRSGEANLADVLDRAGLKGVPAYTLVAATDVKDEARARRVIEASGAVGIVVLRPLGREKEISSTPSMYYGGPSYRGFWGGYYGYGWGGAWGGYDIQTNTYVFVETLIYDLRQNRLVWAGKSQTMNPSDIEGSVNDLAKAVSKELRAAGLVVDK